MIAGHKTSISLEQEFWEGLKEIAKVRRNSLVQTLDGIATTRTEGNLSSAIRLFVLDHYRTEAERRQSVTANQAMARTSSVVTPPAFRKSA
jgi:predicted DNA-binding ribbon-helix-helix protein